MFQLGEFARIGSCAEYQHKGLEMRHVCDLQEDVVDKRDRNDSAD